MNKIIDGSYYSTKVKEEVRLEIEEYLKHGKRVPTLAVVIVGDNKASHIYVKSKEKACALVGINTFTIALDENISNQELIDEVVKLNMDSNVDGILVQLPLPKHLDEDLVINNISPNKDVDGLTLMNIGKLHANKKGFVPCTPKGIMYLLDQLNFDYTGKKAVVIGRSKLVGSPIAKLLLDRNCTTTIVHSKTKDLKKECQSADILVCAIGIPEYITSEYIKENAIVIDVGINRLEDKIVGDVNYQDCYNLVSHITPVPKGVGPMTIAMLLKNTLEAYKLGG